MAGYAMSFNPFLVESEVQSFQEASNPFLSSFSGGGGGGEYETEAESNTLSDNPFLNYTSQPAFQPPAPSGPSNPFADFFDTSAQPPISMAPVDLGWGNAPEPQINYPIAGADDEMSYVPARPPPAPVPRSTQDLLDTVTGALEATSDSLLDRLRVTQPSPIPQVPSPTPSPRTPSPDLWGDDHMPVPPPSANSLNQSNLSQGQGQGSIMDLFDAPQGGPKSSFEILGLYGQSPHQPQQKAAAAPPPPAVEDLLDIQVQPPQLEIPEAPPQIVPEPEIKAEIGVESIQAQHTMEVEEMESNEEICAPEIPPDRIPPLEPVGLLEETVVEVPKLAHSTPVIPPSVSQETFPSHITPSADTTYTSKQAEDKPFVTKPPERPKPPPPMRTPAPPPSRPSPPVPPPPRAPPPQRPAPVNIFQPTQAAPVNTFQPAHAPVNAFQPAHAPVNDFQPAPKVEPTVAPPTVHVQPPHFAPEVKPEFVPPTTDAKAFDAFDSKFEGLGSSETTVDPFGGSEALSGGGGQTGDVSSAWGDDTATTTTVLSSWGDETSTGEGGFGGDGFDSFLAMTEPPPVPQSTPSKSLRGDNDSEDGELSIVIRPKSDDGGFHLAPALAPPPKSPAISTGSNFSEDSTSFVPFLSSVTKSVPGKLKLDEGGGGGVKRSDSQDSPQTPLYEEDQSQPLEDFPRTKYVGTGWDMHMRHPNKKKITGQRFWKKVFVQISVQNEIPIVQIYLTNKDKDPIQEIPLQPCYSVSDISAQQFDQFGKIFTVKLQYVFYKERPGVRPGQISKAERITTKLSQFAAYAIQGDYQGVKEFGSDLRKLGLPLEHAPQISQLAKLGTQNYEEMKQFSMCIEEALFRLPVHRDRAITYKTEEVQVTLVDEYYVEQDIMGIVTRQIARVRLFFLSFLSGSTEVDLGVNDMRRQGREVVGRHDIIPIATEEWIRIEDVELSNCVQLDEFEQTKMVKFKPPDACYIELMRFRVRPPKHRELPLQVKTVFTTTGNRIEIRSDILVPGFTSRKLGQIPCEDVMLLIPIPECWIYMFRVEKHFRYGSVKSAHRRSGKVKGIERFLGAVETVEQSLMEVTSGQAKYEHHHKGIVWRIARLPKEGQGAYTTHSFFCHITLQPHEQIPDNLTKHCYVEFTMPHTTISHTVCRSIAVPSCDEPPEKCVRYLSRHEYIVEIEHSSGVAPATYSLAASVPVKEEPKIEEEVPMPGKAESDSDFSDD